MRMQVECPRCGCCLRVTTPKEVAGSKPAKDRDEVKEPPPELVGLRLYERDQKLLRAWQTLWSSWFPPGREPTYPGVDVVAEIQAAHAWEMSAPQRRKVDRPKFLTNWLKKAQERAFKALPWASQPKAPSRCMDSLASQPGAFRGVLSREALDVEILDWLKTGGGG